MAAGLQQQHTSCRAADEDTACSAAVSPPPAVVVTCAACPDSRLRPLRVSPALSILHCLHSPVSSHTNDNNHIVSPQTGGRMSFVLFEHRIREGHHHPRIIGSGIKIKLGIWRDNLGDRHLASSLVAGDPRELGELTLFATLTQTQTQAFGEFGLKLYTAH